MIGQKDINAYCQALLAGDFAAAIQVAKDHPGSEAVLAEAARTRYLDLEYETPVRRYVNVSPGAAKP